MLVGISSNHIVYSTKAQTESTPHYAFYLKFFELYIICDSTLYKKYDDYNISSRFNIEVI